MGNEAWLILLAWGHKQSVGGIKDQGNTIPAETLPAAGATARKPNVEIPALENAHAEAGPPPPPVRGAFESLRSDSPFFYLPSFSLFFTFRLSVSHSFIPSLILPAPCLRRGPVLRRDTKLPR